MYPRHPPLRISHHLREQVCEASSAELGRARAVEVAVVDRFAVGRCAKAGFWRGRRAGTLGGLCLLEGGGGTGWLLEGAGGERPGACGGTHGGDMGWRMVLCSFCEVGAFKLGSLEPLRALVWFLGLEMLGVAFYVNRDTSLRGLQPLRDDRLL